MQSLAIFCLLLTFSSFGAKSLGNTKAPQGGTFYYNLKSVPTTINPISATDAYSQRVQAYILEGLLTQNVNTYQWEPGIAESWKISKDKKKFTYKIRQGVKWHDGKPLTVEDIKFSFDVLKTSKESAHVWPYLENVVKCEILDKRTVRFHVDKVYFRNFSSISGGIIQLIPKHIYEKYTGTPKNKEQKKLRQKLNKTLIGTGPYILAKLDRKNGITLKRNPNWWGNKVAHLKGTNNYAKIFMRFVKDKNISLLMVKKGEIDFEGIDYETYNKKAVGKDLGKKYFKVKTQNKAPKGYSFIGFNLKNPLFTDLKVRKALYHLVNRKKMIDKYEYGMAMEATGPWYRQSRYANPKVKPIKFDPKLSLKILRGQGWKDTDGDKVLDKIIKGKKYKMSFTILEPREDFVKYLTIFKEDAKKAGIDIKIKRIEWNAFIKLLDERKFEAVRLGWGAGSVNIDPKQIWHSSSMQGTSNFISYSNKSVDKLIDQARLIESDAKRQRVLRKAYKLIAEDYPYIFLFNSKFATYVHTPKIKKLKDTYTYGIGTHYWWIKKK